MADAGDEFTGAVKSIGSDLFSLIKTIVQERQRREREAQAQMAAAAKEQRAEEMAAQHRKEDREFMKAENEKMRTEMRSMLKANGMEGTEENLELTQKQADLMAANEQQIEFNEASIRSIDRRLGEIDKEIDTHLNPKPGPDGITPESDMVAVQKLQTEANNLVKTKVGLEEGIKHCQADNVMLQNGQGLERLRTDQSVKQDLVKQVDQVNEGIARDTKKIADVNEGIAKNEQAATKALSPTDGSLPNMKEWEKLKGEKENLLKEKAGLEKGLTEKQGQLKGLKDGVSLEQLQKAAKIEGNIRQDQQQMAGLNKVTEGYQKNLDALKKANTEALKTPTGKPDLAGVADYEQKIKGLKAEKETLQKKIDEQQKEVQKLKEVPNVEAPKVEAPKVETPQVQGPQVEGVGKQVQGPQGGITSPSVPITEMEGAPKQGMKSPGIEGSQGPQVGAEKIDLSKYKVSPEASAKIGETPKNGKKTVLQTMDERGETPEFTKRKRGMSMGEGLGKQQGVGVGGRR